MGRQINNSVHLRLVESEPHEEPGPNCETCQFKAQLDYVHSCLHVAILAAEQNKQQRNEA